MELLDKRKDGIGNSGINKVENYIGLKYKDHIKVYTDASRTIEGKVGVAFVVPEANLGMSRKTLNMAM